MLRLAFTIVVSIVYFLPSTAAANSCALTSPAVDVAALPVGCPVVILTSQTFSYPFGVPTARANRILAGGAMETIDVTGMLQRSTTTRPIDEYYYASATSCDLLHRSRPETFDTVTIELTGVMPGDQVDLLDGEISRTGVSIVAAGPCPGPDPQTLSCAAPIQSCDRDGDGTPDDLDSDDGGCSAGGSPSLGLALGLALVGLRRRRAYGS